ncbi:hypothetical protein MPSEU_000800100 [Mayamaea pseudoterrestris]|nr:hypothetical protein MPSEU_000800100 [Mayamaea pseudoterrestris]
MPSDEQLFREEFASSLQESVASILSARKEDCLSLPLQVVRDVLEKFEQVQVLQFHQQQQTPHEHLYLLLQLFFDTSLDESASALKRRSSYTDLQRLLQMIDGALALVNESAGLDNHHILEFNHESAIQQGATANRKSSNNTLRNEATLNVSQHSNDANSLATATHMRSADHLDQSSNRQVEQSAPTRAAVRLSTVHHNVESAIVDAGLENIQQSTVQGMSSIAVQTQTDSEQQLNLTVKESNASMDDAYAMLGASISSVHASLLDVCGVDPTEIAAVHPPPTMQTDHHGETSTARLRVCSHHQTLLDCSDVAMVANDAGGVNSPQKSASRTNLNVRLTKQCQPKFSFGSQHVDLLDLTEVAQTEKGNGTSLKKNLTAPTETTLSAEPTNGTNRGMRLNDRGRLQIAKVRSPDAMDTSDDEGDEPAPFAVPRALAVQQQQPSRSAMVNGEYSVDLNCARTTSNPSASLAMSQSSGYSTNGEQKRPRSPDVPIVNPVQRALTAPSKQEPPHHHYTSKPSSRRWDDEAASAESRSGDGALLPGPGCLDHRDHVKIGTNVINERCFSSLSADTANAFKGGLLGPQKTHQCPDGEQSSATSHSSSHTNALNSPTNSISSTPGHSPRKRSRGQNRNNGQVLSPHVQVPVTERVPADIWATWSYKQKQAFISEKRRKLAEQGNRT